MALLSLFRPRDSDNVLRKSPSNENLISVSAVLFKVFLEKNSISGQNLPKIDDKLGYIIELKINLKNSRLAADRREVSVKGKI